MLFFSVFCRTATGFLWMADFPQFGSSKPTTAPVRVSSPRVHRTKKCVSSAEEEFFSFFFFFFFFFFLLPLSCFCSTLSTAPLVLAAHAPWYRPTLCSGHRPVLFGASILLTPRMLVISASALARSSTLSLLPWVPRRERANRRPPKTAPKKFPRQLLPPTTTAATATVQQWQWQYCCLLMLLLDLRCCAATVKEQKSSIEADKEQRTSKDFGVQLKRAQARRALIRRRLLLRLLRPSSAPATSSSPIAAFCFVSARFCAAGTRFGQRYSGLSDRLGLSGLSENGPAVALFDAAAAERGANVVGQRGAQKHGSGQAGSVEHGA